MSDAALFLLGVIAIGVFVVLGIMLAYFFFKDMYDQITKDGP
jgi:hypothetical protein